MKKIVVALLLLCVFSPLSVSAFEQKLVTRFSLEADGIPEGVLANQSGIAWDNRERGPVPGLREYDRVDGKAFWLGSDQGAARFDPFAKHPWDRWQYFWGKRWLADNDVQAIWVDDAADHETVWIRTKTGVSRIEWKPMAFEEKAAHFDDMIEKRHLRHDFVGGAGLPAPGDISSSSKHTNDNDGLWSAMYLVAQVYRYAVTNDPDAKMKARRTLDALIRLEEINPLPGFYARSFVHISEASPDGRHWGKENGKWKWVNEKYTQEQVFKGGQDWIQNEKGDWILVEYASHSEYVPHSGEWHATPDGEWLWKGDTSSDETVGHYYAYAIYYDLVADEGEKKLISDKVRLLTDDLIADDYYLIDVDGIPTRWGNWNEAYFDSEEGDYERALRAMELLSLLKVTYHVTGDQKYQDIYLEFVKKDWAKWTNEYRRWDSDFIEINFSDDELYYLSVQPLMMYEEDPELRAVYLEGMRFTWSQIASDRNPLWNYINAACGIIEMNPRIRDESERALARSPWEAIQWRVENSHRIDLPAMPDLNRHGRAEMVNVIPPDERRIHKHNTSPYTPDGGGSGASEEAPTYWLLPYWIGRYYEWIN